MHVRVPRAPGLPFGGGLNLLLVAGGVYFVWEHGQGRHEQPHLMCPLCWLNKATTPAAATAPPAASGGPSEASGPAEPPEQAG
jgi:hypothetical protein